MLQLSWQFLSLLYPRASICRKQDLFKLGDVAIYVRFSILFLLCFLVLKERFIMLPWVASGWSFEVLALPAGMCYLKADCFKGFGTLFAYLFLNQNSSDFIIQPANKKIFLKTIYKPGWSSFSPPTSFSLRNGQCTHLVGLTFKTFWSCICCRGPSFESNEFDCRNILQMILLTFKLYVLNKIIIYFLHCKILNDLKI